MEMHESHSLKEKKKKKKKKKHKMSTDSSKEFALEDGEIHPENDGHDGRKKSKRKKKSDDRDRTKKRTKDKSSKGFYNLEDYDNPDTEKRRKSVSPIHREGLGYHDASSSKSSSRHRSESSSHRHHHDHYSRSPRSRYRERKRRRSRSRSRSLVEKVDKEKLLQIAKQNLASMVKSGSLPKSIDVEKINLEQLKNLKERNSISQWSEYCRALSVMEAATIEDSADSDLSSDTDDETSDTKSVSSAIVRHPFQLKERKDIQINVKDFTQLPTRSSKEIQKELTEKFPVSFGDTHRVKELEWVEVKPTMPTPSEVSKKKETAKRVFQEYKEPKETQVNDEIDTSVSSSTQETETGFSSISSDIGTLVALKLSAKKKLQQNPLNLVALRQIYEAERLLALKSEEQALVNEQKATPPSISTNQFFRAGIEHFSEVNRIKDGIGMHLLLKMGWQPGQGLGKTQKGNIDPVIPSLKFDTKGLLAEEETVSKIPAQLVDLSSIAEGRNPISALQEYCSKTKLTPPIYDLVEAVGPDHKKSFIMKCILNGVEYRPSISCGTKKQAKALAATVALQAYGLTIENESI